MKIREQFCSYEIAKELKELGFNEECIFVYNSFKALKHVIAGTNSDIDDYISINKYDDRLLAPLYQQIFDWFRNKKVLIEITTVDSWDSWQTTIYMEDCMAPFFVAYSNNGYEFETYELAREFAILKAIELIKR